MRDGPIALCPNLAFRINNTRLDRRTPDVDANVAASFD